MATFSAITDCLVVRGDDQRHGAAAARPGAVSARAARAGAPSRGEQAREQRQRERVAELRPHDQRRRTARRRSPSAVLTSASGRFSPSRRSYSVERACARSPPRRTRPGGGRARCAPSPRARRVVRAARAALRASAPASPGGTGRAAPVAASSGKPPTSLSSSGMPAPSARERDAGLVDLAVGQHDEVGAAQERGRLRARTRTARRSGRPRARPRAAAAMSMRGMPDDPQLGAPDPRGRALARPRAGRRGPCRGAAGRRRGRPVRSRRRSSGGSAPAVARRRPPGASGRRGG